MLLKLNTQNIVNTPDVTFTMNIADEEASVSSAARVQTNTKVELLGVR